MTLTLRYAAQSDRGLIRDLNQDSVYAGPRLLAVADGMGGMAAGDVASNIVIAAMAPLDDDVPGDALVDALRHAVGTANQQLRDTVDANPQMEGMGTTLTAVLFTGSKFGMVHIGDSRAYLLRKGEFAQITKDDTYVQMLVDEGRVSPEEASSHPQRSLLTRALDGRDIDPEYSVRQVLKGDRYMICSDGLSGVVSAETIGQTMQEIADPKACVERLIQLALRGGGPDNITVVIADLTDADIVEQAPIVGGAASLDRGNTTVADSSTPASRAAALKQPPPRPAQPESDGYDREPEPAGHPVRTTLLVLLLLGVLGGGLWAGWQYTQDQYYVGATDSGQLAIFQGVPGQIAGLDLSTVSETSTVRLDDLTSVAQERVKQGIHAESQHDARSVLTELTSEDGSNLKPVCSVSSAAPSASASARPAASTATSAPVTATSVPPTVTSAPAIAPSVQPSEGASSAADTVGCRTAD
ncbi:PP2C family protein-serine/threonine phosphatase [Actinoplanes awajinensis]|uniref:Serine/threonine protein phosphatase PstP n=1 Tax=Actinoplanes awajinensis subsp. mycoplanecinus TaxID=135947 RepID=A0A101JGN4_9ACTN|nr:BofC C-terminal domain-containing protein [Actinoplanes awajinensis]KUL26463.1 protein phosphatase [Actinoplanes awajinensis subsp. mycoplanecinus]